MGKNLEAENEEKEACIRKKLAGARMYRTVFGLRGMLNEFSLMRDFARIL